MQTLVTRCWAAGLVVAVLVILRENVPHINYQSHQPEDNNKLYD